jgi:organic hydroperoxide reductase OsmC/OhrA/SAM-dependent methyltransferase
MTSGEHTVHHYRATCRWEGSTAAGYEAYPRAHDLSCPPAVDVLHLSSDPAFRGDPTLLNPEQLLLAAASSCQLLSFLAVAARARVVVLGYVDTAEAEMPDRKGPAAIERIVLRPHIVVEPGTSEARLAHLVEVAHRECYIANSLRTEVVVEATFESSDTYAFRDSEVAASRLALVARNFDTPSREFVAAATADLPVGPTVAVDLGCGPGHTTNLLSEATGARRTIGLDDSEPFLELARTGAGPGVEFLRHDVSRPGWPVRDGTGSSAGPDLAYGRLVLAHLPDPQALALAWLGELAPGGRLLLDELEWIRTDVPVLVHYLDLVTELVTVHGSAMFAGPFLSALDPSPAARRLSNDVREWPVPVDRAAEMFSLNLSVWKDDPLVSRLVASPEELASLARELLEVAKDGAVGRIVWGLRQVVFERSG